jgi:hypothetical protein
LVRQLTYLTQVLLQNLDCAKLLLLVLDDWLRRDHLLRYARRDEDKVLLGDLDAALLGVELADSDALAHLAELELLWLVARKLDHVQPRDIGDILAVALQHPRRPVEQALKALDQDGSQRPCAEIAGHALMAVQHALVVAEQRQDVGQRVVVCDQGQVVVDLAHEVVDLQVIVRLGVFGQRRRRSVESVVRRAALALQVAVEHRRMLGGGHGALVRGVRVEGGHDALAQGDGGSAGGGARGWKAAEHRWGAASAERQHTTRQRQQWAGLKRHDTAGRHRRGGRRREAGAVRAESCGRQAQRRF